MKSRYGLDSGSGGEGRLFPPWPIFFDRTLSTCTFFDEFKAKMLYKNSIDISKQHKCRVVFPGAGACSCFCPADMMVQVAIPTLSTTSHRFPKSSNQKTQINLIASLAFFN
jgi:hypothetical protein